MMSSASVFARQVATSSKALAAGVVDRMASPDELLAFQAGGFQEILLDTEIRLRYLAESVVSGSKPLFHDHLGWTKEATVARGVRLDYLTANVAAIGAELEDRLPDAKLLIREHIQAGLDYLAAAPSVSPTLLADEARHASLCRGFLLDLLEGRPRAAVQRIRDAHDAGVPVTELYEDVLYVAQVEIGRMWHRGEVHVAEEHAASRAVEQSLAALRERMQREPSRGQRVLVASVGGELHGIALQFIADYFETAGYDSILVGPDTPIADLAQGVEEFGANLVALSMSIGLHLTATKQVITKIRENPKTADVPILVGGRPFTLDPALSDFVGADATAVSARDAVLAANELTARG